MKKVLSLLLSLLLMASIASCAAPAAEETAPTSAPTVSAAPRATPTPTPVPTPKVTLPPIVEAEEETVTVYVTETGSKYHAAGCQYLAKSCIPMDLDDAKQSYDPCSKCHPPK